MITKSKKPKEKYRDKKEEEILLKFLRIYFYSLKYSLMIFFDIFTLFKLKLIFIFYLFYVIHIFNIFFLYKYYYSS